FFLAVAGIRACDVPGVQTCALPIFAYELVADVAAENVVHVEVRFAPVLHTRQGLSMREAAAAVLRGLARGREDFGTSTRLIACGSEERGVGKAEERRWGQESV